MSGTIEILKRNKFFFLGGRKRKKRKGKKKNEQPGTVNEQDIYVRAKTRTGEKTRVRSDGQDS